MPAPNGGDTFNHAAVINGFTGFLPVRTTLIRNTLPKKYCNDLQVI